MICSIGVMPKTEEQQFLQPNNYTRPVATQLSKREFTDSPVPPAIMPTCLTFNITAGDFLSGLIANFPEEVSVCSVSMSLSVISYYAIQIFAIQSGKYCKVKLHSKMYNGCQ